MSDQDHKDWLLRLAREARENSTRFTIMAQQDPQQKTKMLDFAAEAIREAVKYEETAAGWNHDEVIVKHVPVGSV